MKIYLNESLSAQERAEALVNEMTVEEAASQLISDPSLKTDFYHIQIFVNDIQFTFQRHEKSTLDRIAEQIRHICANLCNFWNVVHQRNPTHTL